MMISDSLNRAQTGGGEEEDGAVLAISAAISAAISTWKGVFLHQRYPELL